MRTSKTCKACASWKRNPADTISGTQARPDAGLTNGAERPFHPAFESAHRLRGELLALVKGDHLEAAGRRAGAEQRRLQHPPHRPAQDEPIDPPGRAEGGHRQGMAQAVEARADGAEVVGARINEALQNAQQAAMQYNSAAGEQLTSGDPNLHALLKTKGLEATQDWMIHRISKIYEKEDVLRRHVELTVRNATSTMVVTDPGSHPSILRGDHLQKPVVDEINRTTLHGKHPIVVSPVLKSVETTTALKQPDWMARLQSNRIQQHIMTAAALGQHSDVHGLHPIPGLAFAAEFGATGHSNTGN